MPDKNEWTVLNASMFTLQRRSQLIAINSWEIHRRHVTDSQSSCGERGIPMMSSIGDRPRNGEIAKLKQDEIS